MDIVCRFRNIQEMAQAVRESAGLIEGQRYSPRPWNRFEPENTDWWIVPSTDWPAYRYGKAIFRHNVQFSGQVFCGLNVEKGFGRIALEVYPELSKRRLVIDETWAWFKFLDGLEEEAVARAAEELAQKTGCQVILEISAWYTSSPVDFEPHPLLDIEALQGECRSPLDAGRVWFAVADGELRKLEERCIQDVMAPVVVCDRLGDLAEAFRSNPEISWAWIDVYIGALVTLAGDDQASGDRWMADDIWRKLIRSWLPWIV